MSYDERDMAKYEDAFQVIVRALSYHDEQGEQATDFDEELQLLKELVYDENRKEEK